MIYMCKQAVEISK